MEKGWKSVFVTTDSFLAQIAKTILNDNEINSVIINQNDSSFLVIGEIEIFVSENDFDQAASLLLPLKENAN